MKPTNFYWQWGFERPRPDPAMSRGRAARLLRAWRRASRSSGGVRLKRVCKEGVRAYLVDYRSSHCAAIFLQPGHCAASVSIPGPDMQDPWVRENHFNTLSE